MNNKKLIFIQLVRVISMFSIVFCHLITNNTIAEFLTFGIFTFIFMSGYLYSNKKIDNKIKWLLKQYKKITIPVIIWLVLLIIIYNFFGLNVNYITIPVYIFNLKYFFEGIVGINHLWFCSVIFFCYILTLKKEIIKKLFNNKIKILFILLFICLTCFINKKLCDLLFMLFVYFLGMYYKDNEKNYKYSIYKTIIICFIAIFLKLIMHHYMDDTPIYNSIVYAFVHTALAFSFFTSVQFYQQKFSIKSNKIINYFDIISYYVYITHYCFIIGPLSLINITNIYYINAFIVIVVSLICATILHFASEKTINIIKV